jgi:hypothetical protein
MSEQNAKAVAAALGGYAWHSGGGVWLVRFDRTYGSLALVSEECACEYANEDDVFGGTATKEIWWKPLVR